jgi:hypothetical protein
MTTLLLAATLLFPRVQGSNLAGKKYNLPGDFEGRANIVVVAFKREQQLLVDTWLPTARSLARDSGVFYYELPTISKGYSLMSWMIDGGMRKGIPDPAARAATITLYINTNKFRRNLDISSDETIHVFLVDNHGYVRWRAEGSMTPAKAEELSQAAHELLKETNP